MAGSPAEMFVDALQRAEESKDVGPLVELFAPDAELNNPARGATKRGGDQARVFWQEYLSAFGRVRSRFTHVRKTDEFAVLEWESVGTLPNGEPIRYPGVSVIEFTDGKVSRFSTYYDSAAFLPQGAKRTGGGDQKARGNGEERQWEGAPPRTAKPRVEGLGGKKDAGVL